MGRWPVGVHCTCRHSFPLSSLSRATLLKSWPHLSGTNLVTSSPFSVRSLPLYSVSSIDSCHHPINHHHRKPSPVKHPNIRPSVHGHRSFHHGVHSGYRLKMLREVPVEPPPYPPLIPHQRRRLRRLEEKGEHRCDDDARRSKRGNSDLPCSFCHRMLLAPTGVE